MSDSSPPHSPRPGAAAEPPCAQNPGGVLDIRVDLEHCTDKATLLARFAAALQFPDWFGHNWDALADCITDLSWLPAHEYRIAITNAAALRAAAPETLDTLLEILAEAGEFWAAEGVRFALAVSDLSADAGDDSAFPPSAPAAPR